MTTDTQPDINPPRTIGQASAETEALTRLLESSEVGQVITYAAMRDHCKVDVQEHPGHLTTARRRLLKAGTAFGTIHGVGIKKLDHHECPDEAKDKQERARRTARKGLAILDCADLAKLDAETKVRAITSRTVLGFMVGAGSRKTINLANQAARSSEELKVGKIADLFGK